MDENTVKDSSPPLFAEDSDSDRWALNARQACGSLLRIDPSEANRSFCSLSFCLFSETVMDTRVATAELGWTAYPNSGVSLCWSKCEK